MTDNGTTGAERSKLTGIFFIPSRVLCEFGIEARSESLPQAEPSFPMRKSTCTPPLSSDFRILGWEIEVFSWLKSLCLSKFQRLAIWYFRLDEWLSSERKHQESHPCSCAKSRLGELGSLKRELPSSKRTSLA
ncbi:hypothetical protein DEO72_LG6g1372 [Vigna unguiculata]|uniref:Uncharacterized protein n=1 Tax=Vigna unguiculata TaxID=3917 RepID=A0A4D6M609_VIGUN|nr:hypothetical protein DEO72_LG6g1372 [Vigna unguiculata]